MKWLFIQSDYERAFTAFRDVPSQERHGDGDTAYYPYPRKVLLEIGWVLAAHVTLLSIVVLVLKAISNRLN